jgi:hypothetical protein
MYVPDNRRAPREGPVNLFGPLFHDGHSTHETKATPLPRYDPRYVTFCFEAQCPSAHICN